jgi:hypothetical protein
MGDFYRHKNSQHGTQYECQQLAEFAMERQSWGRE